MAIYALFYNISAKSGLGAPFTTAWSKIDSITLGAGRQVSTSGSLGTSVGALQCDPIQLHKLVDGATSQLLATLYKGIPLNFVNIAITDATNKTITAYKLFNVLIEANQYTGEGSSSSEVIDLVYQQIAIGVLTAGTMDFTGWDVTKAGLVSSNPFTLDPTYGIKIA